MKLRQILILGLVLSGLSGLRAKTVVQTVQFDQIASFTEASGEQKQALSRFFVGAATIS